MEKTLNKIKKSIAVLTATSLLISFVVGPTAASAMNNEQTAKEYNQIFKEFILPYSYGKITKSHFAGTDRVIINIQDLHCHPKVQKNISNIIKIFDEKYGVNNIYLEGAYGNVSTKWITDQIKKDKNLLEKMLDTGRLTGAEYYSALSGKTELIQGLEEKEPYLDNITRLGSILDSQEKIDLILKSLDESVNEVKKKYYTKRQYKIEHLFKEYKDGKINSQKYYTLLSKHIDKLGIDLTKYENTLIYVTLLNSQKDLNYKQITKELQSLIAVLKQQLPYNTYKSLLENTSNFQEVEKLYSYIIQLDKVYNLDISLRFIELNKYFGYIELSKKINPVELVKEDEFLSQEINTRFSQTPVQKDVVFLVHFGRYLRDYVTTKITLEDYKYYKDNIQQYRNLYNKYVDNRVLSLLDEYIAKIDKFYEINMDRNIYFTKNMFDDNETFAQIEQVQQDVDDINKIISNMDEVKQVDIVVTGGFHSQTVTELLEQQNVSYIVITPNVTDGIKLAEETYYELAKEQSKISFQTIAPVIASLSPQLQAVLLSKIETQGTEKTEQIMKLNDIERAQTISDLAVAKLLESDDLGNLKETLNEIVKNLVDEYHKEKVTPELVSEIKNLQSLLKDKEKLQKVIDLLNEGPAKQAVMLISDILDDLYSIFDSFVVSADKQKLESREPLSPVEDFDMDDFFESSVEKEGDFYGEDFEYDYSDELDLWFSDSEIIDLCREIIREGQYNRDIESFISYLGRHNMADYELLSKVLAELKSVKNSEIKKEYCGVLYALIDKDKDRTDEEKALETKERIMSFFEKPKLLQLKFCDLFSVVDLDYNNNTKKTFFDALIDVVNKGGYESRDIEFLFEVVDNSRLIAELGTRENLYDFLSLSIEKRRLLYNFYKSSENNFDIGINQLTLNFIISILDKYNFTDEQFNYIMNLICSIDLNNDEVGKEYVKKLKESQINLLVLEQFKYINERNKYIADLLFSDIDKKHIKLIVSNLQEIINLFNALQEYQIDTLETENKGLALSIFSTYAFREYCEQNNITDIVKKYQLAIRVSRRMYSIIGENIFSLSSLKTDDIIKETLAYYEKADKNISLLNLFTSKTAVFSLHNSERNLLDKDFRFTPTGIKELFKRLDIEPEVFETIEISFLDKISDFINATEQDEINKQTLLDFVNNLDGSIALKKDMLDYISKQKNNMLSKRTLNRYIGRLKTTEPLVEANRFLKFIEHFNDYGQEKGVFIFDGHGTPNGQAISYSQTGSISVSQITQALIKAHDNGVNLENLTLMFSSCHSYKFADNVINKLMENGITEFPQIITDAGKETVYGYTKTLDLDGKEIRVSNLFYSLFKFLDSKTQEEREQLKGRLTFKDVADAPRYLSNNTLLITNQQINELNRELEATIRNIIGEDIDIEVKAKGKDIHYAEMMLPVTKQILDFIGNTKIIKSIYKRNAGDNFKFTSLGVALGAIIETFSFWSPSFIKAHNFDPSIQAGMTAVVWAVRALSIGIGIWTGSILALFLAETITHFIWNMAVILIERQDLLLQTSKAEEINTSQQKWTMSNISKEAPYTEKYKLVYYIFEKNCRNLDIVFPEELEYIIIDNIIDAYDSSFWEIMDFEDWVYNRLIINIIDFQQKQDRLIDGLNDCRPDDKEDILWIFSQCLVGPRNPQFRLNNIIAVATKLEEANKVSFSDEVYQVLNILQRYNASEAEQIFINMGLIEIPNALYKQVMDDRQFKQLEDSIRENENRKMIVISEMMLPSTQKALNDIGNTKIIKSIYKRNAGENFKFTSLGVALGAIIETFSFWSPSFIKAHNFDPSIQAGMIAVVWAIRALTIGAGLATGTIWAAFLAETILHYVWNRIVILSGRKDLLLQTSKTEQIIIPVQESKEEKGRQLTPEELAEHERFLQKTISQNDIRYQYQPNPELKKDIEEIFGNLLDAMAQQGKITETQKKQYRIHYYYSPVANAYTITSSKDVFIFSELIYELSEEMKREGKELTKDHIAAILAHELQHTTQENRVYTGYGAIQGDNKRKEYDADRESIFILEQAGYNPRAVEQMMSALISLSSTNALQAFFDAHPNTEDRLKEISEILENPSLVFLSMNTKQQPIYVSSIQKYTNGFEEYVTANFDKGSNSFYSLNGSDLQKIFDETDFFEQISIFDMSEYITFYDNSTKSFVFKVILNGNYKFFTKAENEFIKELTDEEKDFIYSLLFNPSLYGDNKIVENLSDEQKKKLFDFYINVLEPEKIKNSNLISYMAVSMNATEQDLEKFLEFRKNNNMKIPSFSKETAYFYLTNYKYLTNEEIATLLETLLPHERMSFLSKKEDVYKLSDIFKSFTQEQKNESLKIILKILSENKNLNFMATDPMEFINFVLESSVLTKQEKLEYLLKLSKHIREYKQEFGNILLDLFDDMNSDKTNVEKLVSLFDELNKSENIYYLYESLSYEFLMDRYDISNYDFSVEELKNLALSSKYFAISFDVFFLGYFLKLKNKDTKIYFVKDETLSHDKKYSDGICLYPNVKMESLDKNLFETVTLNDLIDFQTFMIGNNYYCQIISLMMSFVADEILNLEDADKIKIRKILTLLPQRQSNIEINGDISEIPYEYLKNLFDVQIFYKDVNEQLKSKPVSSTNFINFYVPFLEFKMFRPNYAGYTFEQIIDNIKVHFDAYSYFKEFETAEEEGKQIFYSEREDIGNADVAEKQIRNMEIEKAWLAELHRIFNLSPEEKNIEFKYGKETFVYTYFKINEQLLNDTSLVLTAQQAQQLINAFSVIKKELSQETVDVYAKLVYSLLKRNPNLSVFSSAEKNLELLDLLFEDFSVVKDDYITELLDNYDVTVEEYKKIISRTRLYFFNLSSEDNNKDVTGMELVNTILPTLSDSEKIKFFFWLLSNNNQYKPQMLKQVKILNSDYDGEINFDSLQQSFRFMTKTERENLIRRILLGKSGILEKGKSNAERNSKEFEKGLKNILFDDFFISSIGSSKIKASSISIVFKEVFSIVFTNLSDERKVLFVNNLISALAEIKTDSESVSDEQKARQLGRLIVALGTSSGVAVVKLLQILSNNRVFEALDDKYGPIINEEVAKVKNENEPLSKSVLFQYLEKLGLSSDIEYAGKRLGSASIGLTYLLKLKNIAELVVAKIKRPNINKNYYEDFRIADKILEYFKSAESLLPEIYKKTLPASDKLKALFDEELEFEKESENLKSFSEQLKKRNSKITVPQLIQTINGIKVYTQNLFLQTTAKGKTLDKIEVSKKQKSRIYFDILKEFFTEIFVDPIENGQALYHADLHTGNIFVDAKGNISFIDLGGVGKVSAQQSKALKDIFMYLYSGKYADFINALKTYNVELYNDLEQEKALDKIEKILTRKTSLESKFVDLFEIFNSLKNIDSDFMMFIQAISKISGYLDNLDKKEQLALLNNLRFERRIQFKIISDNVLTAIVSAFKKIHFGKQQQEEESREITQEDIFREKILSNYPDMSSEDMNLLLTLDSFVLEYIKSNTVNLTQEQLIRGGTLADKLYKQKVITGQNNKINLLFKIISITTFSDKNIEKLLTLDENTIEKIISEIKENEKIEILFTKAEQLDIELVYKDDGFSSNNRNFDRLLMFAKGDTLNRDGFSSYFYSISQELEKATLLFSLPLHFTRILLEDEDRLHSVFQMVHESGLSVNEDADIIDIIMALSEKEIEDIEFCVSVLSRDGKNQARRFFLLYKDYKNLFQEKDDIKILSSVIGINRNDEQIRELFDSVKNTETIKFIIQQRISYSTSFASEDILEIILFRCKTLDVDIDKNNPAFVDIINTFNFVNSTGLERISRLDEDTYKKLLSVKDNTDFKKLLEYISSYSYFDRRNFEELLNKALSAKNTEAEVDFDENDYVTALLIKKDDGTQYSVRLSLTRIKDGETDYIRTGISNRKMVVYLSSLGEDAFSKATIQYTSLEDIEKLTGVKIEVSGRTISAKSVDSKADVRFVRNRDISQTVSSLQIQQIPAIDEQQKSDVENISNAEVTEIVYLDESPEIVLEKLKSAIENNSLIVIYPFSHTYDMDSLTDDQLYSLYFDIQSKFLDIQEMLEYILPKIDNRRGMSYVLKEFMKNAFVHGNLSDTSEPVYIKFIENGFTVINAKHTITDNKIKTNRLNLSAAATLTGAHKGLQIIQDYEQQGLIRVTPEERRNVKEGKKEYFVITAVKTSGNGINFNSLIEQIFDKKDEIEHINDSIQNNRDEAQKEAEYFLSSQFTPEELEIVDLMASVIFDSIKYVNSTRNTSSIEFVNIIYALQNGLFNDNLLPKEGEDLKQHITDMLKHYIEVSKQKKGEDNLLVRTVNSNKTVLNDIADYLVGIIEKNNLVEKNKTEKEKRKVNMQRFIDGVKGDDKLFSAVMICSANENRSAIWHIMFKDFLEKHNKRNTKVFSAGVFYDISQRFMNENNTTQTKPLVEDYIETLKSDERYKNISENLRDGFRSRYIEYLNLPKNSQPVFIVAGEQHRAQLIKLGYPSSWIFLMSEFYTDDFKKQFKQKNRVLGQQLEDNNVFSMSEFPDPFENQILRQDLPELVGSVVEYNFEGEATQQQLPEEFVSLTDDYNQFEHMENLPDFSDRAGEEEKRQNAIQNFNEQTENIASQEYQFRFRGNTKYLYLLQNKRNKYILLNIASQPKIDLKFRLFALLYLDRLSYDLTSEERANVTGYKSAISKKLKKQIENNEFTVQNNLDLRAYMMGVYLLLEDYSYRPQVPRRLIDRAIIINGDEKTMGRDDGLFAEVDLFIVVHELSHVMVHKPKLFNNAAAEALDEMVSYITPNIFLRKIVELSFSTYSARQSRYTIHETDGVIDYVKMGRKFHSLYSLFDEKVSEKRIDQEEHSAPIAFLDYLFKAHEQIGKSVDWDILLETIGEIDDSTLGQHSMFKFILKSYLENSINKGLLTKEETGTIKKEIEKMQMWTLLLGEIMDVIETESPEVKFFLNSEKGFTKAEILANTNKLKEKEILDRILKAYQTKVQFSKSDLIAMLIIEILKNVEYEQLETNFDGVINGIIDAINSASAQAEIDLQKNTYNPMEYRKLSSFVKNNFVVAENKGTTVIDNIIAYISNRLGQVLFVEPLINKIFGTKDLSGIFDNRKLLVTSSTEQTDRLNQILKDNNVEDTTVVTMEVITSPAMDIRDGIYLDVLKGIKAKYDKDSNTITVYSKKGISDNENIEELIMQQYFSERKEDSFDDIIAFADINDSSLQDITNRLKNAYTDSVSMPNKDTNFDLSSRNIKNLVTTCNQEFVSTDIKTFIITSEQARNFADDIKSLREQNFKFIVSCKVNEIADITNYDGLIIDASLTDYEDINSATDIIESVKKKVLTQGVAKQISVKFSNSTYQQFNNAGINIFDTYGIVPIVVNSYMVNSIIGKCAVEKITEDSIDRLMRQNNIIGLVIDDARIFSGRKNNLKGANTKEQKYNKGYNASLSSKFDYVCIDVSKLENLLAIDINNEEQLVMLQNVDLETLSLSADSLTYLNYLKSKGRYEEMAGFIRGIAMNSARAQIVKVLKDKEINLDMDKFAKEAGGKYQKAFLTVAVQLMMEDIDITEFLETDFIDSDMTTKQYLDSVYERVNINIEDILKQNEFKIEKAKDTAKTIEDFKNYVVLLDNLKILKETTANFDMSMKAVRSMLSAA